MKELGYHEGYQYAHDAPEAYIPQEYLPEQSARRGALRAWALRIREGDREAARVVGGAERKAAADEKASASSGETVNREHSCGDRMRLMATTDSVAACSQARRACGAGQAGIQGARREFQGREGAWPRAQRRNARRRAERSQSEQLPARRDAADVSSCWSTRVPFGTGALDKRFTVAASDSTMSTLPLRFTYAGSERRGRELINNGTVPYRVLGRLTVGSRVGNFTIQYDRTGHFNSMSARNTLTQRHR